MKDELIKIFDDNYKFVGNMTSAEVHEKGLWHEVFHCWLVDTETNKILYQLRSKKKKIYPNKLDVSIAGHCEFQESIIESIIREAKEELGLILKEYDFVKIGIRKDSSQNSGVINREFQHIFFLKLRLNDQNIIIQESEVKDIFLINPNDVIDIYENKTNSLTLHSLIDASSFLVQRDNFIESIDMYNYKIPHYLLRFIRNEKIKYF